MHAGSRSPWRRPGSASRLSRVRGGDHSDAETRFERGRQNVSHEPTDLSALLFGSQGVSHANLGPHQTGWLHREQLRGARRFTLRLRLWLRCVYRLRDPRTVARARRRCWWYSFFRHWHAGRPDGRRWAPPGHSTIRERGTVRARRVSTGFYGHRRRRSRRGRFAAIGALGRDGRRCAARLNGWAARGDGTRRAGSGRIERPSVNSGQSCLSLAPAG